MEVKAEYRTVFIEEAREHLEQWEQALLALERAPGDRELINQLFRSVHTLKGSAGFIGFSDLQRIAHQLEAALQQARDGDAQLDAAVVEALFRGLDLSRRMIESFAEATPCNVDVGGFLATLPAVPDAAAPLAAPAAAATPHAAATGEDCPPAPRRPFAVRLNITSSRPEAYLRSLLVRGRLAAIGRIVAEEPSPEVLKSSSQRFCYRVDLETAGGEDAIRRALDFDQVEVEAIEATPAAAPAAVAAPPAGGEAAAEEPTPVRGRRVEEVVRVSVERLDGLLNLVGELVIQNSGFSSLTQRLREAHGRDALAVDLEERAEALAKITRDLQDGIMKVRMLPVSSVFSRFQRVVRDLCKVSGKQVDLQTWGSETEIDKKVMDRIGDPLVHLVRNAVDHGIESRQERQAAGKSPVGTIRLGAYQDGDHICIEVSDDGKGLDREAILAKGIASGLLPSDASGRLSEEQIFGLIFLPGFTTARQVTEVSGRGVGMDVVRREIEALGGSVRVRSSRGRGTVVTLALPLTMAIVSALLVEAAGTTFAIPLSSVGEVLKVDPASLRTVARSRTIRLREEVLGLLWLQEALSLDTQPQQATNGARVPVVVVDHDSRRLGLGVAAVIGTGEIVIKSLSRHYREIDGLIGASILGNGRIALILDVEALVRRYYKVEGATASTAAAGSLERAAGTAPVGPPAPGEPETAAADSPPAAAAAPDPQPLPDAVPAARSALLEEVHNAGAIQASIALGQLTNDQVAVSFPESQLVALSEVATVLGGEEKSVGGIYVGLSGDLSGGLLLALPGENLPRFHELMYRQPPGSCPSIAEADMSAIQEVGNIIAASFINAVADAAGLCVRLEPPEVSVDMCAAVVDSVLARFNQPGERLLLTTAVVLSGHAREAVCQLLLFLEPESLSRLTTALAAGEAAGVGR